MDLIRIFIDTAFSKIADRFLKEESYVSYQKPISKREGLIIDEAMFVDECRCFHPELSDDQIRMIFGLYRDEWSSPYDEDPIIHPQRLPNIFNVLFRFSHEVLRFKNDRPTVIFRHLFRWRELTLNIGEDTLVAAFLAYHNRNMAEIPKCMSGELGSRLFYDGIDFCSWPTVLHNDNPHLEYIFENNRLCDLHSHLNASTDNFTISWVSLMNNIANQKKAFIRLGKVQDESRYGSLATSMYSYVIFACCIRLNLWKLINNMEENLHISLSQIISNPDSFAVALQKLINEDTTDVSLPDYIVCNRESPMSVIAGERKFLYGMFRYIMRVDDERIFRYFYLYLIVKNKLRSFLVQVNSNRGFANFKRYQDLKVCFMLPKYRALVSKLAIWEATKLNYTDLFETRIAPFDKVMHLKNFKSGCMEIEKFQEKSSESDKISVSGKSSESEWSLLIHFLKHPENFKEAVSNGPGERVRDWELREEIHQQSIILRQVVKMAEWEKAEKAYLSRIRGIDAASSEIGCRPEIFAQAFRFLKASGYAATFHVGEDFYDIADGLRAIDEAITFLSLEAGDRLGHALALGVDPDDFYNQRHNHIALPLQWMLDNVVWLYYTSRRFNILIEPSTEDFLHHTFRDLVRRIGYESQDERNSDGSHGKIEMIDYYQSMLLRGDTPKKIDDKKNERQWLVNSSWDYYKEQDSIKINEIRKWNNRANVLFYDYMNDRQIIPNGRKIKSFQVPDGYRKLIRQLQDKMMQRVSKKQLGIECCPSSNYKIGYCKRYDMHPIFRFMPVKTESTHHLAVTVNTDDLGVFSTSLPNEYSLLTLALMKKTDSEGNHLYSPQEVYDWVERVVKNGDKFAFKRISRSNKLSEFL